MRWLLGNFADPQYELTQREQWRVTKIAHESYLSPARLWGSTIAFIVGGCLLYGTTSGPLSGLLVSWGVPFGAILGIAIPCLVVILGSAWLYRFIYRTPVRRAMRELGYDICIGCGYRLEGLGNEHSICPECGTERELT
jgi:hypothetical protein